MVKVMEKWERTNFEDNCMINNCCLRYFYHKSKRSAEISKKPIFALNKLFCSHGIDGDFSQLHNNSVPNVHQTFRFLGIYARVNV